ncbi:hypothetical protein E2562_001028 [Oryza meyeriana var. granulata]|uniref:Uncharacterized protein n=1 Tax=Oryza meyeriana var. granulata TaxID=110450 RepID=A0A6G1ED05_9ORYZ|nr:hypothetical protein E2562_001028 [Oryza meyeriana var. granulata]
MELYAKRTADMMSDIATVLGASNATGSTEGVANPPNDQQEARDDEQPFADIDLFPSNTVQPAKDVAGPSKQASGGSDSDTISSNSKDTVTGSRKDTISISSKDTISTSTVTSMNKDSIYSTTFTSHCHCTSITSK